MRERTDRGSSPQDSFSAFAEPMTEVGLSFIGRDMPEGASVLDLSCGWRARAHRLYDGSTVHFIGLDIDLESLQAARGRFSGGWYVQGDAQRLPFRESSFDAVFSFSVLQYVDPRLTVNECARVLKPGGKAVFIENLVGNPFVGAFRLARRVLRWRSAPNMTPRAHLRMRDLERFRVLFEQVDVAFFHLLTPVALTVPVLRNRIGGRPWRVTSRHTFRLLCRLDRMLLERLRFLRRCCWMAVVCARKQRDSPVPRHDPGPGDGALVHT